MTVEEMLNKISSAELVEWMALYKIRASEAEERAKKARRR